MYFGKITSIVSSILTKRRKNEPQGFYVGGIGRGKAYHPWDYLPKCICGGYPYMVSQNDECYKSGEPNRIYCLQCGKSTAFGTVLDIRKEWAKMNLDKDTYMSMEDLIELRYEPYIIDPEKDYDIVDQKEKHPNENQKT